MNEQEQDVANDLLTTIKLTESSNAAKDLCKAYAALQQGALLRVQAENLERPVV